MIILGWAKSSATLVKKMIFASIAELFGQPSISLYCREFITLYDTLLFINLKGQLTDLKFKILSMTAKIVCFASII